jgi:hypothetical protein
VYILSAYIRKDIRTYRARQIPLLNQITW